MSLEQTDIEPEAARDGLLACINDLRILDTGGAIAQVLEELKPESRIQYMSWDDLVAKIHRREYTTYNLLQNDVQAVLSVLTIPDKKRSRLQKACAKVMKDMRKQWSMSEVQARMHIYAWHPGGPSKANEVCFKACVVL
jgi:hypothetical protein